SPGLEVDGHGRGGARLVQDVGPASTIDISRDAPAEEVEAVGGAAAGEVLEREEGRAGDLFEVGAEDQPGGRGVGADQGVGAGTAEELLDVGERAADAGCRVGLEVDGHRTRTRQVVENVGPAAAIEVARDAA